MGKQEAVPSVASWQTTDQSGRSVRKGRTVGAVMRLIHRIVSVLAKRKVQRDEGPQDRR
jgi:hypothetical protein